MFGVGTILAGKYRVERVLGEGGMGIVVAATHLQLGTQVALKFLHAEMSSNQQMAERFMREARASAQLRSEHVCRVSDVGILETGAPYIVMELLDGQDLASMLKTHGPMPIGTAADYMLQALSAIAEAHAAGIVHRDLKPGNLMATQRPDGTALIKVLDFGIAKAPGSVNFSLTQTSSVMGSPGYMSPEQLKSSKEVDARSDIWSLGIVLHELVTGRTPFLGESITEIALRVAMDPTPQLPPSFPRTFAAVVARCLEKDPARRYQDVAELAIGLAPFAPRGAEIAQGITRVLRGNHAAMAMRPNPAGPAPTVPPTYATGMATPTPSSGVATPTPTTLGQATGMVGSEAPKRRGLVFGVIGGLVVGGIVFAAIAIVGGKSDGGAKGAEPAPAAATAPPATTTPPTTTPPTTTPPTTPPTATPPAATPPATTPPATAATTTPPVATPPVATPPVTVDAGVAETPVASTPAEIAVKQPATKKPATKPTKKPTKQPTKQQPEDVGDSRL